MSSLPVKQDAKLWLINIDQPENHSKELMARLNRLTTNEDDKHDIETELLTLSFDIDILSKFYISLETHAAPTAQATNIMPRQVKLKINRSFDTDALFRADD
ncbi:hypothetical protein RYA05_00165 [Pseudomonas syringae pv. actinidiae]|nr:hypothetical protein [Pseudomonas syringae pv. actinidiae]